MSFIETKNCALISENMYFNDLPFSISKGPLDLHTLKYFAFIF